MDNPHDPANIATLLWFPKGKTPAKADFDPADEALRAEPYWHVNDALVTVIFPIVWGVYPDRSAWILYRDTILDEAAIKLEWQKLHALVTGKA
jgi:hypothetical protein